MKGGKIGGMANGGRENPHVRALEGTDNIMNELWDAIFFWIHRPRRSVWAIKLLECDTMQFFDWLTSMISE